MGWLGNTRDMPQHKRLYMTISYTHPSTNQVAFYENIEADDLVELMAKFPLTIAKLARQLEEEKLHEQRRQLIKESDDIPF